MKNWRVFDECEVRGFRFAILVNDEERTAAEAVWHDGRWETDFSYSALNIDLFTKLFDVAGSLDFEGCRQKGYTFQD